MSLFNDPVSQWLMFAIAAVGILAVHHVITSPPRQTKKEKLRKQMWEEYNRISRVISGSVTLAGVYGLSDSILDMRRQYRKVRGIEAYSSALFAKLFNRESELRKIKYRKRA